MLLVIYPELNFVQHLSDKILLYRGAICMVNKDAQRC